MQKQQGDTLYEASATELAVMPEGDRKKVQRTKRGIVIAEGEHNGHAHVIEDDEAELIQIGERMLLILTKPATVKHDEHGPISLEPGIWEIGRVREKDWLNDMVRTVAD
jgi:hypothetical protein